MNEKIRNYLNIPKSLSVPPNDFSANIVNFGFQQKDSNHSQGPLTKTEHVLQYVVSGKGTLVLKGVKYSIKAADMFYLPKNTLLSYYSDKNEPYEYFWIGLDGVSVKQLIEKIGLSETEPVKNMPDECIIDTFVKIETSLCENNFAGLYRAHGELFNLLSLLLSYRSENLTPLKSTVNRYVENAVCYIETNFGMDINVTQIAKTVGLSRNYLCVLFGRHMGISPVKYLMNYRIEQSRKMLAQKLTVTETALNCGFNSPANFSVQFKKITGMSPVKYRTRIITK